MISEYHEALEMGGFGSGRWGGRPTIEATASFVLDISIFVRGGLKPGMLGHCSPSWRDRWSGEDCPVDIMIDTRNLAASYLQLWHMSRSEPKTRQHYQVNLTTTTPRFGGVRWWFRCPRTGQRCAKLFLPLGGRQFWSRGAYGLDYQTRRETRSNRLMRRSRQLHRALGGDGESLGQLPPPKPKGMWWRTYERKVHQWRAADDRASAAWAASAWRLIARSRER